MQRDTTARSNAYSPLRSRAFKDPLLVRGIVDLLALAGIWVVLILIGQVVMGFYTAVPLGKCLGLPALQTGGSLVVVYLALDVVTYLWLRGRLIFQWMVPGLCLAVVTAMPGLIIYLLGAIRRL